MPRTRKRNTASFQPAVVLLSCFALFTQREIKKRSLFFLRAAECEKVVDGRFPIAFAAKSLLFHHNFTRICVLTHILPVCQRQVSPFVIARPRNRAWCRLREIERRLPGSKSRTHRDFSPSSFLFVQFFLHLPSNWRTSPSSRSGSHICDYYIIDGQCGDCVHWN